jgi:hypothetical protein
MTMKVVGRQGEPKGGLAAMDGFFKMVIGLRGSKPFLPKGVHRFRSFDEADEWKLRMITRR